VLAAKENIDSVVSDGLSNPGAKQHEGAEEIDENLSRRMPYVSRFRDYFIAIGVAVMTLGQFSEAVTLIEDGYGWISSKVTHSVEYDLLKNVHVGNTHDYIEALLGSAQVSRSVDDGVVANYYCNNKYLLTVFLQEERVVAYTYIPLIADFKPTISLNDGQDWLLQDQTFSSFPASPATYVVDHSKTISYYLENLDGGRSGIINQNYLGKVALGNTEQPQLLVDLNKQDISGSDVDVLELQTKFRDSIRPNLYGSGTLTLALIQKSLLTSAEFSNYFKK